MTSRCVLRLVVASISIVLIASSGCSSENGAHDGNSADFEVSEVDDVGGIGVGDAGDESDAGDADGIHVGDENDADGIDVGDAGDVGDSELTPAESCHAICDRLDGCDAGLEDCASFCLTTIEQWGTDPIASFRTCFLDDHDCWELQQSNNPPQMCYEELDLPEEREARCDEFVELAENCAADSFAVQSLSDQCRMTGRTRDEADWAETEQCIFDGSPPCAEALDCLNEVFEPDPKL